jgi:hypothetical protein
LASKLSGIKKLLNLKIKKMKQITKFFAIAIVMVAFSVNTFAQVSATANASATIITPITITRVNHMNFGNVAPSGVAGTVVLSPAGGRVATNCTVYAGAAAGTVTAASFTVSGMAAYTYSILLPAAATTITGAGLPMTVDIFTSTPTVAAGGTLDGTGNQTLLVGATLNVGANQAAGLYTSGTPFTVTVNYN